MSSVSVMAQDPKLRGSLQRLFDRAGFTVTALTDPADLLASLAQKQPQCVVAQDLSPTTATIDLLTQIRSDFPGLPVILIARGDDVSTAVKALRAGAFDCVQSPIVDRILVESVNSAISTTTH